MANSGKPVTQRQLRVGEMIKQSLSMIFLKDETKIPRVIPNICKLINNIGINLNLNYKSK